MITRLMLLTIFVSINGMNVTNKSTVIVQLKLANFCHRHIVIL